MPEEEGGHGQGQEGTCMLHVQETQSLVFSDFWCVVW